MPRQTLPRSLHPLKIEEQKFIPKSDLACFPGFSKNNPQFHLFHVVSTSVFPAHPVTGHPNGHDRHDEDGSQGQRPTKPVGPGRVFVVATGQRLIFGPGVDQDDLKENKINKILSQIQLLGLTRITSGEMLM